MTSHERVAKYSTQIDMLIKTKGEQQEFDTIYDNTLNMYYSEMALFL